VVTEDIIKRLQDIASLRGPMAGNTIPTVCLDAIAEIQQLQQQLAAEKLEVQRIRKVISHYCEIENHYSQAWNNDSDDTLLLREDWQNAWQALEDEALRHLMNTLDYIYYNND